MIKCICGDFVVTEFTQKTNVIETPKKKIQMTWLKCPGCKREYLKSKLVLYKDTIDISRT